MFIVLSYSQVLCLSSSVLDALGKKVQALKARTFPKKSQGVFWMWKWWVLISIPMWKNDGFHQHKHSKISHKVLQIVWGGPGGVAAHVVWVGVFPRTSWLVRPTKRSWFPARRLRHVVPEVAQVNLNVILWYYRYSRRWISPEPRILIASHAKMSSEVGRVLIAFSRFSLSLAYL